MHKELLKALVGVIGTIVVIVAAALALGNQLVNTARAEGKQEIQNLRSEVQANKREADAGNAELRKDVQALYMYMVTKQRQERLEKTK